MDDGTVTELLAFFSALADDERLAIAGMVARQPASLDEIVALSGVRRRDATRHLTMLERAGIVTRSSAEQAIWRLDVEHLRERREALLTRQHSAPSGPDDAPAAERRVLETFFDGDRLRDIPVARVKRLVVLRWLAGQFDSERRYPERDVNEILKRHHPDAASLRRALVDEGLMRRDSGVYWRTEDERA